MPLIQEENQGTKETALMCEKCGITMKYLLCGGFWYCLECDLDLVEEMRENE